MASYWGTSWGTSWGDSFGGEEGGPISPPVETTGAGPGWPIDLSWFETSDKARKKRWKRDQDRRDELRKLLRKAFGLDPVPLPSPIAGEIREIAAPFVEASKATPSKPARMEIDWTALEQAQTAITSLVQILDRYEMALEADNDDEDFLVLM